MLLLDATVQRATEQIGQRQNQLQNLVQPYHFSDLLQ